MKKKEIENIIREIKQVYGKQEKNRYYNFGYEYFGPFLLGYINWLQKMVFDYNKIFFFSRDGYMMIKAFEILVGGKKSFTTEYVYFSRKSLRQALLWTCKSYEESIKYLSSKKYISFGEILEYYGFSEQERNLIAQKEKLSLTEDVEFKTLKMNTRMKELYQRLSLQIKKRSKGQDSLMYTYLEQIGMEGSCAIVDIGWHGNMQYYLEEFIYRHCINAKVTGYYVGISPVEELRGHTEGYLYNAKDMKLRKSTLCFFGGLEKFFQSMEGSVYSYKICDGKIVPVNGNYEYEKEPEIMERIRQWQSGALDFIKDAININISSIVKEDRDWAMPLLNLGKYPSKADVSLFSFFYNIDGKKEYFVSQKPLLEYNPKELIHALSNSTWKTGFMKSLFKIPFPYYWIYWILRK